MLIERFLQDRRVPFHSLPHRPTFDAQHLAQAVAVPGDEVAKAVLLHADEDYVLAVLPATHMIDMDLVKRATGAGLLELASEREIAQKFPDCEVGALPVFGSQYGIRTLVDQALAEDDEIVFESNTHEEAVQMRFADYRELEDPVVARISYRRSH